MQILQNQNKHQEKDRNKQTFVPLIKSFYRTHFFSFLIPRSFELHVRKEYKNRILFIFSPEYLSEHGFREKS